MGRAQKTYVPFFRGEVVRCTTTQYDDWDRAELIIYPELSTKNIDYMIDSDVLKLSTELGNSHASGPNGTSRTHHYRDMRGNLVRVDEEIKYDPEAQGNPTENETATTLYEYDGLNRLVKIEKNDNSTIDITDPDGNTMRYRYGGFILDDTPCATYGPDWQVLSRQLIGHGDIALWTEDAFGNRTYDDWSNEDAGPDASYGVMTVDPEGRMTTRVADLQGFLSWTKTTRQLEDYTIVTDYHSTWENTYFPNTDSPVPSQTIQRILDPDTQEVLRQTTSNYARLNNGTPDDSEDDAYLLISEVRLIDDNGTPADSSDDTVAETRWDYDSIGRLLAVDYPSDIDIAYTYDALGRKLTMTDASGTTTYTYDALTGRMTTEDGPFANDTITYTWDDAGRRDGTTLNASTLATYAYDTQGRMSSVVAAGVPANTFTYSYDGASQFITGIAAPGGITTAKTYDSLNRLASIATSTVNSFTYTYDDHDRRTRVDLLDGGRWEYSYDSTGQVVGGTRYGLKLADGTEAGLVQYGYTYDPMGNPTQRSEDAAVSTYTYNNLNQLDAGDWNGQLSVFGRTETQGLSSLQVASPTQTETATVMQPGEFTAKGFDVPVGDQTLTVTRTADDQSTSQAQTTITRPASQTQFAHDLNGNMLGDGQWTYTWNDENRLTRAERPGGQAAPAAALEFVYDGQGRRRIKREYTWADDAWVLDRTTAYTWDGWLCLSHRTTEEGSQTVTDRTYVHGLDLSGKLAGEGVDAMSTAGGIGGILAVKAADMIQCFTYDGNGNVMDLVDPVTGLVTAHYEYSPFGKTIVASGPLAEHNPYRFSTKEQDATSLLYYGYRYHSPSLGRWVNRDPIGRRGGANLYLVAGSDLVGSVDGHGLRWERVAGSSVYKAGADGDDLETLARMVSGDARNWVCIWPIHHARLWRDYPNKKAKRCARAYVGNLLDRGGSKLALNGPFSTNWVNATDPVEAYKQAFGSETWADGAWAATRIRDLSKQGLAPIQNLYVIGHHGGGLDIFGKVKTSTGIDQISFEASDLFAVATESSNSSNSYASARQGIGPPKCWFTVSADVWGLACKTEKGWMGDWAGSVMRKGSTVHGTTRETRGRIIGGTPKMWYIRDGSTSPVAIRSTVAGVLGWTGAWKKQGGTQ